MSKKKFYVPLIATMTVIFVVAMGAVAVAVDNLLSDGVIATTPVSNQDLAFGNVCPGKTYPDPSAANVALAISNGNNDNQTFADGASVAVSRGTISYPVGQAAANGTLSAPLSTGTITLPGTWVTTSTGTLSDPVSTTVTLTVGSSATAGSYSGTVPFRADGDQYNSETPLTRSHDQAASWTVLSSSDAACVTTPTNDPPVVTVTGVTNGANYEYGSVPAASCSVSDTEDGTPTIAPVIGAVTGPLSAYGLGSQEVTCSYTDNGGLSDSDSVTYNIVDTTAPAVTVTPDRGPDLNGWYNAPVVFTTTGTDAVGIASCTAPQTYSTPDGEDLTVSGSCTDIAGNVGNGTSDAFDFDDTNPTVTVTPARAADHNGWYNAPVVFDTSGNDGTGSGVNDANCTADQNYTGPDGEDLTVSGSCTDNAGNVGNGTSAAFDFDDTDPTAEVTGYEHGDVFVKGATGVPPTPGCSAATDAAPSSGVASTSGPTLTAGGLNSNGVGSATYTCTATDNAGNVGSDSKSFSVVYGQDGQGIRQPINIDNTSLFSRGRAVPVKFGLLYDEPNGFSTSGWNVTAGSVNCQQFDLVDAEAESVSAVQPGGSIRYDSAADQYIYNADFRSKAVGTCWRVFVNFDDGTKLGSAIFKLTK